MKLRHALLAASILAAPIAAIPGAAFAQPVTGPYVSLGTGATIFQSEKVKDVTILGDNIGGYGKIRTDADLYESGAIGYGLGNGLRIEIDGVWDRNALRSIDGYHASGFQEEYSGFANVLYDFDLTPYGFAGLSPYVGVGAGYTDVHNQNQFTVNPVGGFALRNTSSEGDFAVQGIVGVAYNLSAIPGLALTLEYRYAAIPDDLHYHAQYFAPGVATRASFKADGVQNQTGLVGLRYALWQPAPPVAAAAAAAVQTAPPPVQEARTYLVFFDWDRADLTARARQIVAEAAQASTHVATTRIEVNGYTDLSGTAAYNQRLSVRRAESVEAELVRDGVARNEIAIHGFGESNPLVPTAPGVREPQNRRVEIILK
jgi:outer membrane protein OmpA-like peptidoglycan-associated protein